MRLWTRGTPDPDAARRRREEKAKIATLQARVAATRWDIGGVTYAADDAGVASGHGDTLAAILDTPIGAILSPRVLPGMGDIRRAS